MTTLDEFGGVLGQPLDTFFWAHNFMVTALDSCVMWPLISDLVAVGHSSSNTCLPHVRTFDEHS